MKNHLAFMAISCLLALFISAVPSHSRIWHVNISGTGDAPTIQAAIDSSSAGDTILVGPGAYGEREPTAYVESKDSLTLLSEAGPENTVLQGLGVSFANYITIIGFSLSDAEFGVTLYFSHHVRIEDNVIRRTKQGGLVADAASEIVIKNNLFHSCAGGLHMTDASDNVEIDGNTISHCGRWGIYTDGIDIGVKNNIVSFNDVGISAYAPYFLCNDVYGNATNYDLFFGGDPTGTNGNISHDPQFCAVDPAGTGNYLLQSDSPCAPGNHPDGFSCGVIGRYPVGCQSTAVQKVNWGVIKSLYR